MGGPLYGSHFLNSSVKTISSHLIVPNDKVSTEEISRPALEVKIQSGLVKPAAADLAGLTTGGFMYVIRPTCIVTTVK